MLTAGLVYVICLFITGIITIGGTGAACNLPIIMSCLSESQRTSGIAVERFFGTVAGSFAVPLVGFIAENYFGYHLDEDHILDPGSQPAPPDKNVFHPFARRRAVVVGDAITLVALISWVFCICIWYALPPLPLTLSAQISHPQVCVRVCVCVRARVCVCARVCVRVRVI